MLDNLTHLDTVAKRWSVNPEDVLLIALNSCGARSGLGKPRMRFRLRLDSRPDEPLYLILSLGRYDSLVANEQVLAPLIDLLSPNIRLISSHLVVLASIGQGEPRTIRTPGRPGWHRDMYGVTDDLGIVGTPRLAIKCAYYLSEIGPDTGTTMFLPGSHKLCARPVIPADRIDPDGAITPKLGQCDAVLFENRTWHAGGLNFSGAPRIALMMQYGYRWLAPVDDTYQRLLETEAFSDVQRQLLGAPD